MPLWAEPRWDSCSPAQRGQLGRSRTHRASRRRPRHRQVEDLHEREVARTRWSRSSRTTSRRDWRAGWDDWRWVCRHGIVWHWWWWRRLGDWWRRGLLRVTRCWPQRHPSGSSWEPGSKPQLQDASQSCRWRSLEAAVRGVGGEHHPPTKWKQVPLAFVFKVLQRQQWAEQRTCRIAWNCQKAQGRSVISPSE